MLDNVAETQRHSLSIQAPNALEETTRKEFGEISADNAKPFITANKDGKIYPNSPFMTQHMFVCTFKKNF